MTKTMEPDQLATAGKQNSIIRWVMADRQRLQTLITLSVLLLMLLVFSSQSNRFFEITNLLNVARQVSPLIIVASAATLVMIARGVDLSVGSVIAASVVLAAYLSSHGMSLWLAYLCAIGLGTLFGLTNALIIVKLKVTPIIATLGTLNAARGVAYLISPSAILVGLPKSWDTIGTSHFWGIPISVIIAGIVFILFYILLNRTIFGRHVYAIGGNEETALLSGVNVERETIVLYVLTGMMTGLAAIVLGSRLGSGDPNIGVGFEFQVIVAIILGGTSFSGGEGRLMGTLIGAFIVGFLGNGLNLAGVEPFWQYIAQGIVLVFAVALDHFVNTGVLAFSSSQRKKEITDQRVKLSVERNTDSGIKEV